MHILETLLKTSLCGISLSGLALRTRSKVVKSIICEALGYPIPKSFVKTHPKFPCQNFDVYTQKSLNVQIWNEDLDFDRRYVFLHVTEDDLITDVRVITGKELSMYDKTGTLTHKYQALMTSLGKNMLFSENDTDNIRHLIANNSLDLTKTNPNALPKEKQLLSIKVIYNKLLPIVGKSIKYIDSVQERNRGAELHKLICNQIGYSQFDDDGTYPDITNQLIEIKLQTSPTIDLGRHSPEDDNIIINSSNMTDNIKRGMREMPEKGEYFHTAPVGYLNQRTSRHQTTINIDPIMGPIVKKLFYEYASGIYYLADLTRMADELGFQTIRGNKAHKQTIINMLKNPFYCGFMRCYGQLYPHNYEKLINKELFDKCQDLLLGRSSHRKRKVEDMYRGMIRCKDCGRMITPDPKTNRYGKKYTYLFCPHCRGTCVNENIVDAKIEEDLCKLKKMPITWLEKALDIIQEEVREKHKMEIEERRILKSKRTQLANNLDTLLDMRLNNSITQEQYNKKYNDITKQIETTDRKLTRYNEVTKQGLNTLEDLVLLVSKIPEIYESSNFDEKRKVLKLLYSNFLLEGKNPLFSIRKPLENILSGGFRHVWSCIWHVLKESPVYELPWS